MKTLKNLALLLFVSMALCSCSGDDNESSTTNDPLIGSWITVSEKENGVDEILTDCDLTEVQEFLADGTVVLDEKDLVDGECVSDNPPAEANLVVYWTKVSGNTYHIKITTNGTTAFEYDVDVVFSNNNNTINTSATDTEGNLDEAVLNRI